MPCKADALGDEHCVSAEVPTNDNQYRDNVGQHVTYYEHAEWQTRRGSVVFCATTNTQILKFCMASLTPV